MMRKVLILQAMVICLSFQSIFSQSFRVEVIIIGKDDKLSMPGVIIQEKGTQNILISDVNGKYSIQVPSDTSKLVFSFVGCKTQEILVAGNTKIDVELEISIPEFFDDPVILRYINLGLMSSVIHTPFGIEFEHLRPYLFHIQPIIYTRLAYQTNFKENKIISVGFSGNGVWQCSGFNLNFNLDYNNYTIGIDSLLKLNEYKSSISFYINKLEGSVIIGTGYHQLISRDYNSSWGLFLGFRDNLFRNKLTYQINIGNWREYWDFSGLITYRIPNSRFSLSISHYRMLDYSDYTLKLNYRFSFF
jgi:hypothetical protein